MRLGVDGVFTDFQDTGAAELAAVPEPRSDSLMVAGLRALLWLKRRRRGAVR
jgi:glycerophosphoryl diester phosphodiesterase